jgi:ubiquinone/menaquinone biosynthesis C-methylase UbiE
VAIYRNFVFPRLCDWALRQAPIAAERVKLLQFAEGDVLEIGFGTGLNLPHYPAHVHHLTAIDANPGMQAIARKRVAASPFSVQHLTGRAEQLPIDDARFETVISTFTLCSVEDADAVMGEVFRVLRPGGRFLLLEHGLSPDARIARWQRRLNWLQRRVGDGCRLDRDMRAMTLAQPFSTADVTSSYMEKSPPTHGYVYRGIAVK